MRTSPTPRQAIAVQVASLCLTAVVVWITRLAPQLRRYSPIELVGQAVLYSLLAWCWCAFIVCGLYLVNRDGESDEWLPEALRTSAAAVWFAPAILLASAFSPAAIAASLALVVNTTRLLYVEWLRLHPPEPPLPSPPRGMFSENEPPRPAFLKTLVPSLVPALSIQIGTVALAINARLPAAFFLVMGAAMLTMFSVSAGAWTREPPPAPSKAFVGVMLTILLSASLTVGGLSGRLRRHPAGGEPAGSAPTAISTPAPPPAGDYAGVILWPEIQRVTTLVAPVLSSDEIGGISRPLRIPFGGEYWMFRSLYRRPPPGSSMQRGNPSSLSFATTDRWPLMMEAHQKLDQPLDLRCCRKVRLEIRNADRYPGTVRLELIALDSDSPGPAYESLGSAPVRSTPDLAHDPVTPAFETLEFNVPAIPTLAACTEFKVVFQREYRRIDKSARVAIESFVLEP